MDCKFFWILYHIQGAQAANFNILGGHSIGHYMYMCPIRNGLQDGAMSLYSCKIVAKVQLRIVSNIGIYCSNGKVGSVYPVQYICENSTVNIQTLRNSCEDMLCCWFECILTLFYAGHNIHYKNEQFVSVPTFVLYTSPFIQPHKQKSKLAQNGMSEGQFGAPNPNSGTVK